MRSHVDLLRISALLGWQDVKKSYRRSALGPFWSGIGLGIQVAALAVVFGSLTRADFRDYVPFLAISLALWRLISSSLIGATTAYRASIKFMLQMETTYFFAPLRMLTKNGILFVANFGVFLVVAFFLPQQWTAEVLLAVFGLIVLIGNLYWAAILIALGGARFGDLGALITSGVTLSFYVTPVLWMPSAMRSELAAVFLNYNPFFHLMEVIRSPLLGESPATTSWAVSVGLLFTGNLVAWVVAKKFWWRVVYWL